ncbi:MAG: hypothetical protein WCX12_02155 [Candidatus Paceibacterota bacterium]|jgi:hypothetical protein
MQTNKKIILAVLIIVIIGGGAYGLSKFLNRTPADSQGIACTQEALLCPDGSYVSRTGSKCKFAACPNQPSFTGTLRQNAENFSLIFSSPENGGEVSYVLPLVFESSSTIGQLVGQKIRVFGTFTEGITLSVNRFEKLSGDAGDPTLGEIGIGKSVFINGVRITLNRISQDSRCPTDVQCIQAGWVTTNVTLQSDTDKETRDISSNAAPVAFDSFKISIESIKPSRVANSTPKPENYLITFRVKSN